MYVIHVKDFCKLLMKNSRNRKKKVKQMQCTVKSSNFILAFLK